MIIFILIMFTGITTGLITFYHFKNSTEEFYTNLLEQKEINIQRALEILIASSEKELSQDNLKEIFQKKIPESSAIQNIQIEIYNLQGHLLASSNLKSKKIEQNIDKDILNQISPSKDKIRVERMENKKDIQRSYSYIYNQNHEPVAILSIPFIQDQTIINNKINDLYKNLALGYFMAISLAILLAWWATIAFRKKMNAIISQMERSHLQHTEVDFDYHAKDELGNFIVSYNKMTRKLRDQSDSLLKLEREKAWKDVARQVAHEIKNPLTPMRLLIQNFQHRYDPTSKKAPKKIKELCKGLIQQIDTLSAIASAFSEFTNMPDRNDSKVDILDVVHNSLSIFDEDAITFKAPQVPVYLIIDETSLVRIITNVVKNAFQAVPYGIKPKIEITIKKLDAILQIKIKDNGTGISKDHKDKLFIPKFTTKSSGSGIGLAMVKKIIESYNGNITFENNETVGATFIITLPLNEV
ncbi:MAG: ATP-binding protein [Weeksellaceae bacterium]